MASPSGTDDGTGRDAGARQPRGWCGLVPGHGQAQAQGAEEVAGAMVAGAQTTRTGAQSGPGGASRGCGRSRAPRPVRHGPGQLPRAPLRVVLLQWAAKVAFFKLKLDQLMDSLCRVCLAESKQNLEDRKRSPSACVLLHPRAGTLHTLLSGRAPAPGSRTLRAPPTPLGALCRPSNLRCRGPPERSVQGPGRPVSTRCARDAGPPSLSTGSGATV